MLFLVFNFNINGLKLIYYLKICFRYVIIDMGKDKLFGKKEFIK